MFQEFLPLQDLVVFFKTWNFQFCFFCHCVWAATQAPEVKKYFLLHYWVCYLAAFGGALATSLLVMQPSIFTAPLFGNSVDALMWTIVWWAVNYFPFGLVRKFATFKPVWTVILAGSAFCRACIISSRVDFAVETLPNNMVAATVLGTMASMAGKSTSHLVLSAINVTTEANEVVQPGLVWWSGFLCTCFYYFSGYVLEIMKPQQAWALNCAILTSHAILSGLTSRSLDFTAPFKHLLCFLGNLNQEQKTQKKEQRDESGASNGQNSKKNR